MTPEQFLEFARIFPEPLILLTGEGEVLATNRPAATLLERRLQELRGTKLFEWVLDASDKVTQYLQACATSRSLVLGSLTFRSSQEDALTCRCVGAVVQPWSPNAPATILLRLETRAQASQQFIVLNQQIEALAKEVHERQQVQDALSQSNQVLEQALQELQQTQAQLVQNEKMSSLGQMVAGVAHEINNPVNFIHGSLVHTSEYLLGLMELLQLYHEQLPQATPDIQDKAEEIDLEFILEDLPKIVNSMQMGTNRIREIVQSLKIFSRSDTADSKPVNLHEGIDSTLMILSNRLKANAHCPKIEVVKEYGNLPPVECYAGQLNQVFMNILSNAIDALEDSGNKHPQIRIRMEIEDEGGVTVRISDNGLGMPEEIRQKLFDPFFTTKSVGKGTGLGLSISYRIVTEKHNGKLWCSSLPGQGTEFFIQIPQPLKASQNLKPSAQKTVAVN